MPRLDASQFLAEPVNCYHLEGDSLQFVGFGEDATFTNIDATHWQINYNSGTSHEVITFNNGASIHASDFVFI